MINGHDLVLFPLVAAGVALVTLLTVLWPRRAEMVAARADFHRLKQGNVEHGIAVSPIGDAARKG